MRIMTYSSNGGLPPYAAVQYCREHDANYLSDQGLADFVMGFLDRPVENATDLILHPEELRFKKMAVHDGITTHVFIGWTNPHGEHGFATEICVNEYNEKTTKVQIETYDGAETLRPLPEFVPDPYVPGLYKMARQPE